MFGLTQIANWLRPRTAVPAARPAQTQTPSPAAPAIQATPPARTRTPALDAVVAPVSPAANPGQAVLDSLAPLIIHGRTGQPFDITRRYREMPFSLRDAWALKDAGALAAWSAPAMRRALVFSVWHNSAIDGDHLGRAFASNVDSSLWYQWLAGQRLVPPLPPDWRRAIELATLMLDIGDDPRGNTGFMEIYKDAQELPPELLARVALLVAGSGRTGVPLEEATDPAKVRARAAVVAAAAGQALADPEAYARQRSGLFPAGDRREDPALHARRLADLAAADFVSTPEGAEAFAAALLIVKLSDMSRGQAYEEVTSGGRLEALGAHRLATSPLVRAYTRAAGRGRPLYAAAPRGAVDAAV